MKQTQKQWILEYIETFGSVTPAKMGGKVWNGKLWPACGMRRCQELAEVGVLRSVKEGKYATFYLNKVEGITEFKPVNQLFAVDQLQVTQ